MAAVIILHILKNNKDKIMKNIQLLIALLFSVTAYSQDCNLNEEAKRHWYRAEGFREAAGNEEDYLAAANEYDNVIKYAPNCPDAYYNKAVCCEILCKLNPKNCDIAIMCYKNTLS